MNRFGRAVSRATITAACLLTLSATLASPAQAGTGHTPYQPGPMLQEPSADGSENRYGYNMINRGPGLYEYQDQIPVRLYVNRPSEYSGEEAKQMRRLDKLMPAMVQELNRWVGGRLVYKSFANTDFNERAIKNEKVLGIHFKPGLGSKGWAHPNTYHDADRVVWAGGIVDLIGGDMMPTWNDLLKKSDKESKFQVYNLVMHEMVHILGLGHYTEKFKGHYQLMSGRASGEEKPGPVDKVLGRGDKAGLLAMAGFPQRAKKCALDNKCQDVWDSGPVVFPWDL